jgi:hypothetical protein
MKLRKIEEECIQYRGYDIDIFMNDVNEIYYEIAEGGEHEGPFATIEDALSDAGERIDLALS